MNKKMSRLNQICLSLLIFYEFKIQTRSRIVWETHQTITKNNNFFLPHPSSPARIFSNITPVPSLPLKRGSTSPSAPSPQERVPTGKPDVLYSQTSSRPKGLLVIIYATELRLFNAIELRLFYAAESRLFYARYASVWRTMCDRLCADGAHSDGWLMIR